MFESDYFEADELGSTVKCPHCTSQLLIEQGEDDPKPDDLVSCYFHGVIGSRESVLFEVRTQRLAITENLLDAMPPALNNWGYRPQLGDNTILARVMFAESDQTPNAYPGIGWSIVNRVGNREFEDTLSGVINQRKYGKQFASVGGRLWNDAAIPSKLNREDFDSYQNALRVANGILGGYVADPTRGATYFFSGPKVGWFRSEMSSGLLVLAAQPYQDFTFLKAP